MRSSTLGLFVAAVLTFAACGNGEPGTITMPGDARACTLIGCQSGVFWRFEAAVSADWPRPLTFEACIDDHCETSEVSADQVVATYRARVGLYDGIDREAEHVATVRVVGPAGVVLLQREDVVVLSSIQPNGPDCPPTCWQATISVDSAG
jgi:hypothetical protein